jgi:predicted NBD/HSP70 family sugar kinase
MILAIDTGGTKTLIAEIDGEQVVREKKIPTPHDQDEYIEIVGQILSQEFNGVYDKIVVAVPADIDGGRVTYVANLPWRNFAIIDNLRKRAGWDENTPVYLINDARLAALGVATGQGRDLYVTLSTGIGVGLAVDGRLVRELDNIEAGHILIGDEEWETLTSARAFTAKHGKFGSEIPSGDPVWDDCAQQIALGLAILIPMLRPDKIFFGGPLGAQLPKFQTQLAQIIDEKLSSQFKRPELLVATSPEHAVILGAARYNG